ncbi:MAG TPA: phenylalanine--tRNA ligase subunit alpha [Acidimicrobiales bacterium]|nr:phenylalanine--tRNA ligase subunit alpha [Acidimicrobiales bacterium]
MTSEPLPPPRPDDDLDVDSAVAGADAAAAAARTMEDLRELEASLLGKRGLLTRAQRTLGALEPEQRRLAGARIAEGRRQVEEVLARRTEALRVEDRHLLLSEERLDLTEVLDPPRRGHLHIVQRTRDELEDVFVGMGFVVAEGPEVETDWYNFEALNLPPAHPARGMWDTFYLELGPPETVLLRTHTSPVQIRLMQQQGPPIYAVMPGRCYRRDTPDARHIPIFHQVEGLVVDRGITFGDLAGTIEAFTTAYFGPDVHSRLRPAYFPFTEPSAEYEITCTICQGSGCRTCSQTGWIELGGAGMVDPAVFGAVGLDPEEWTGFAFGFGIDRCAQMRHEIPDMRVLIESDVRFLQQI